MFQPVEECEKFQMYGVDSLETSSSSNQTRSPQNLSSLFSIWKNGIPKGGCNTRAWVKMKFFIEILQLELKISIICKTFRRILFGFHSARLIYGRSKSTNTIKCSSSVKILEIVHMRIFVPKCDAFAVHIDWVCTTKSISNWFYAIFLFVFIYDYVFFPLEFG